MSDADGFLKKIRHERFLIQEAIKRCEYKNIENEKQKEILKNKLESENILFFIHMVKIIKECQKKREKEKLKKILLYLDKSG